MKQTHDRHGLITPANSSLQLSPTGIKRAPKACSSSPAGLPTAYGRDQGLRDGSTGVCKATLAEVSACGCCD